MTDAPTNFDASLDNGDTFTVFSSSLKWPAVINSKFGMNKALLSLMTNLPRKGISTVLCDSSSDLKSLVTADHICLTWLCWGFLRKASITESYLSLVVSL